jgi:hypothetical protein
MSDDWERDAIARFFSPPMPDDPPDEIPAVSEDRDIPPLEEGWIYFLSPPGRGEIVPMKPLPGNWLDDPPPTYEAIVEDVFLRRGATDGEVILITNGKRTRHGMSIAAGRT